jgi:hypothetical protein
MYAQNAKPDLKTSALPARLMRKLFALNAKLPLPEAFQVLPAEVPVPAEAAAVPVQAVLVPAVPAATKFG